MDKCKGLLRLCHSSDEFLFIWYFFGAMFYFTIVLGEDWGIIFYYSES